MPDRRLSNRIARRLAVFGPAAIVVLTGLLAYGAVRRVEGTRSRVQHTHDVLNASTGVLTALLDAETSARGYVITHDTSFLAPGSDAPARAARAMKDLRELTVDNASQQRRIDTLSVVADRRLAVIDSAVRVERMGRTDLTAAAIKPGPAYMAEARRLLSAIQAEEDSLLVERRRDEARSLTLATIVIVLGVFVAALLALMVNRSYDRALAQRREAMEELRAANEQLQQGTVELEIQAEAAREAAVEAEQATEQARDALVAAEESERRAEQLQAATEAFSGALEIGEVANLIVDQSIQATGASSGAIAVVEPKTCELRFLAVRNISIVEVGSTVPMDAPYPICAAARDGRPVIAESAAEIGRQFPDIVPRHEPDHVRAVAAFPLKLSDRVMGVLLMRFDRDHPMDPADRAFMSAMSRIAAETFERARLFEAEREARAAAEGANRAKAAFLASMSHELRTPLQAALGFAQLVRSGIYGPVNDQQGEVLGRVERSQMHLSRLIDDILDFARLEAGRVRVHSEPVKLAEVIADLGPLVEPQAVKKKIELSLLPPADGLCVVADRHRLQQILVNLVGNAIKFTPEHGIVRVGAVADGPTANVFITDNGMGIPRDRLQAIFEPFVQVEDSLTRTAAGAGLGLAISRDLARAMGGDLTVDSELGKGSTFTIILPVAMGDGR